jgi:threonine dehydrogenase-like Zn-dependent dehydrogenase
MKKLKLIPPHSQAGLEVTSPILAAFSGGADSSAMLYMLKEYCDSVGATLYAAHVNHGIRGADADRAEEFCTEVARKLGADLCIDPINENVKAALTEKGIERISCVIECVGKTNTMEQAIDIAGKNSVVMMFGLTAPDDVISVKPFEIFKKEIVLKASFINPYTQKRALELIDNGKIDVTSIVYACEGLEKLPEILADGKLRAKGKFIINPQN